MLTGLRVFPSPVYVYQLSHLGDFEPIIMLILCLVFLTLSLCLASKLSSYKALPMPDHDESASLGWSRNSYDHGLVDALRDKPNSGNKAGRQRLWGNL